MASQELGWLKQGRVRKPGPDLEHFMSGLSLYNSCEWNGSFEIVSAFE